MKIKWYGHSCFLLTDSNGSTVLTDPCDPSYGYEIPPMHADIVTISHEHNDHNNISILRGNTEIIRTRANTMSRAFISRVLKLYMIAAAVRFAAKTPCLFTTLMICAYFIAAISA